MLEREGCLFVSQDSDNFRPVLKDLIKGLEERGKEAAEAILQFGLFLKELKHADEQKYVAFMSLSRGGVGYTRRISKLWDQLANPCVNDYALIIHELRYIKKSSLNRKYFAVEEKNISLGLVVLEEKFPDAFDRLKSLAHHSFVDPLIRESWQALTPQQKNELAGVLDKERYFVILKLQKDPREELRAAMDYLEYVMWNAGGREAHPQAAEVLKRVIADIPAIKSANLPLFAELIHRTAVGIRDPLNEKNLDRYLDVVAKISKRTWGQKIAMGAMAFSAVVLFGAAAALAHFATGGVSTVAGLFVTGAVLSGVGGTAFSVATLYTWKRPPHYPVKVAAMSFLKEKKPVEIIVEDLNLNPPLKTCR